MHASGTGLGARLEETVERFAGGLPARVRDEARISVWLGSAAGEVRYDRAGDDQHYAASTMKLPLLVAAYRRHERGELDLDRPVRVQSSFRSALDGSTFTMRRDYDQDDETWAEVGAEVPLRELARRSIVRSGNLATNVVLEHVGPGEVAAVLVDAGCSDGTLLPRGIEDAAARDSDLDNLVTAADLARVLVGVVAGSLAGATTSAEVERVLAGQEHRDKIPSGVPPGTYVANKTGWVDGVAHDVALVRPEDAPAYVLAVCTSVDVPEEHANAFIASVSRAAWAERKR